MNSINKVALITSITEHDGSYLAEFLLDKGYIVHGIKKRSSSFNTSRIDPRYFRPTKVEQLLGGESKARKKLDWKIIMNLGELIGEMIKEDLNEARKEYLLKSKGFPIYDPEE